MRGYILCFLETPGVDDDGNAIEDGGSAADGDSKRARREIVKKVRYTVGLSLNIAMWITMKNRCVCEMKMSDSLSTFSFGSIPCFYRNIILRQLVHLSCIHLEYRYYVNELVLIEYEYWNLNVL